MNVVTIGVSSVKEVRRRTAAAFHGGRQGSHISFASEELLWKTLTPKRWALLKIMAVWGPFLILDSPRRGSPRHRRNTHPPL